MTTWIRDHHSAILLTTVVLKLIPGITPGVVDSIASLLTALVGA